jgi:hypothetical protein
MCRARLQVWRSLTEVGSFRDYCQHRGEKCVRFIPHRPQESETHWIETTECIQHTKHTLARRWRVNVNHEASQITLMVGTYVLANAIRNYSKDVKRIVRRPGVVRDLEMIAKIRLRRRRLRRKGEVNRHFGIHLGELLAPLGQMQLRISVTVMRGKTLHRSAAQSDHSASMSNGFTSCRIICLSAIARDQVEKRMQC